VRIELDRWSKWPGGRYDRRPCPTEWYNDPALGFLLHSTDGFFLNKAQNVTLRHCMVTWGEHRAEEFRHALSSQGVSGLVVEGFKGESAFPEKYAAMVIEED
jgi:hypothetical protein